MLIDKSKILVIAAHPNDDILGCGGLMAKYSKKCRFNILFIAEGVSARFDKDKIKSDDCKEKINARKSNCIDALNLLGINDPIFIDYPCGRLDTIPIIEINKKIEEAISIYNPDVILTHSPTDCNNDHRLIYKSVMMATRPGGLSSVNIVANFEINSSTEWNFGDEFCPNFFEGLSDEHLQLKLDALSKYVDEIRPSTHPRSIEGVKILARHRGFKVGLKYAEAFKIVRQIIK